MATRVAPLTAGEPAGSARPLVVSRVRQDRRILADRWASRVVVLGGFVIIASILAILFVIVSEVYPLFKTATIEARPGRMFTAAEPVPGEGFGVDEYREIAFAVARDGSLRFVGLRDERPRATVSVPGLDGARVTAVAALGRAHYLLATSDGRAIPLEMKFAVDFGEGRRTVTPAPVFGSVTRLDPAGKRPILRVVGAVPAGAPITVAQFGPRDLAWQSVVEKKALIGGARREETLASFPVDVDADVTALALDGRGEDLILGTSRGMLVRYDLRDRANPVKAEAVSSGGPSVTALGFLIGDRTLVVGDSEGGVSTWQVLRGPGSATPRLTRIHEFRRHAARIVAVAASARDKSFAVADSSGLVRLDYATSGHTLREVTTPDRTVAGIAVAPKGDGLLVVSPRGDVAHWSVDNPHPEITLTTLFEKVWYEGYSEPAYVWQSTGGTDDFEAKFSLTPLVFGTLKGTFYALLIAVPIALLAALYVSEFMHPGIKAYLKPIVEIMAALPSVVLGFLAGLWLAPMVERVVPGLFVMPFVLAGAILGALVLWRMAPARVRTALRPGGEIALLVPVVLVGGFLAFMLGGLLERTVLGGDYRGWLLSALGLTYDQRNSLVVGIAMGFAVIPIIFTITEDSLANVPQHLRAGALALGATRWQTAIRVVLPTASPGIFSAVMIGFGRAVGETMIVLMATGNTPVMDGSIFSGFRALSANIAVELPEAPEAGTLFRVLFLAAFLLFCLTFIVNTAAEMVRLKLRKKYRYL